MASTETLERAFEALANEHRREIVGRLAAGPIDTPVLGTYFPMSKQALHQHLSVLERAGLIDRQPRGRVHRIELRAEPLDQVVDWLTEIRRGWDTSLDRLGLLLEENDK